MNERAKHRPSSWVANFLIFGLAMIILAALATPGRSAEPECRTYDSVLAFYESLYSTVPSMGAVTELSGAHKAAAIEGAVALGVPGAERATRVFRAPSQYGPEVYAYGLEVDGCILDPVYGMEAPEGESPAPSPKLDKPAISA